MFWLIDMSGHFSKIFDLHLSQFLHDIPESIEGACHDNHG